MDDKNFEIVVIGSGGAGSAAAIEAKLEKRKVCIVCKSFKFDNKTAKAQGGIQASFNKNDSEEMHFQDTIKAGNNNKVKLVRILVNNAKDTVLWLESLGVKFDKQNGSFILKRGAGMSYARIVSCGDSSGLGIIKPLHQKIHQLGIPIFERLAVLNIEKAKDKFKIECKSINKNEQKFNIIANSVVLATGGDLGQEKKYGLESKNNFYDGKSITSNLGLVYKNQDLKQYHPLGVIYPIQLKRLILPESMRFEGAKLLNIKKEEFLNNNGLRNEVTRSIIKECADGNAVTTDEGYKGVWFSTSNIERKNHPGFIKEKYPTIFKKFSKIDYDLTKRDVIVFPALHYTLGGVEINENAETNIKGIFAAGEATWGVHGKERMMGNSLTDIFVFGRIAGKNASVYVRENKNER